MTNTVKTRCCGSCQLGHTVYTTVCSIYFQARLRSHDVVLVPGSASNAIFHLSVSRVCVFIREFAHACIYAGGESRPLHVRAAVLVSRRPAPVKPSSDCRLHPLGQGCVGWWRWWWWRRERGKQHLHHVTSLYDRLAPLLRCSHQKQRFPPSSVRISPTPIKVLATGCQLKGWLETSDIEGLSINQAAAVNILCVWQF